jgi:hypothetical protein
MKKRLSGEKGKKKGSVWKAGPGSDGRRSGYK